MKYGRRASALSKFQPHGQAIANIARYRLLVALLCVEILLVAGANRGWAVILSGGDLSHNSVAPSDDPGWDNVGIHGGGTAVYLGNRWVITADHLRLVDTITFSGIDMTVEGGTETILLNPSDERLTVHSDLRLVRLEQDPELPSLTVSAKPPPTGSEVLMIGRGRDGEDELTQWTVSPADDAVVWTETSSALFDRSGYKWTPAQTMRWGTNVVVSDESRFDRNATANDDSSRQNPMKVVALATRFDQQGGTEHESHATRGDSGGGVFFQNDGQWELAGILVSVDADEGQPENAAVFGNLTEFADLSVYLDQIVDIVSPQVPRAGDANQDFSFDRFDLVRVLQAGKYLTGQPVTWGEGDWNEASAVSQETPAPGDGIFDQFDIVAALQTGLYQAGPYGAAHLAGIADAITPNANRREYRDDSLPNLLPQSGLKDLASDERLSNLEAGAFIPDVNYAPVPEPAGIVLLLCGAAILAACRLVGVT